MRTNKIPSAFYISGGCVLRFAAKIEKGKLGSCNECVGKASSRPILFLAGSIITVSLLASAYPEMVTTQVKV